jgi:hypothetical protein
MGSTIGMPAGNHVGKKGAGSFHDELGTLVKQYTKLPSNASRTDVVKTLNGLSLDDMIKFRQEFYQIMRRAESHTPGLVSAFRREFWRQRHLGNRNGILRNN